MQSRDRMNLTLLGGIAKNLYTLNPKFGFWWLLLYNIFTSSWLSLELTVEVYVEMKF